MLAPLPLAHQCAGSTPFEKKTMPRRRGGAVVFDVAAACAKAGRDSIQGRDRATPIPRRKWRRDLAGA